MTAEERISYVKTLLNNEGELEISDAVIEAQLLSAKSAIFNRMYPANEYDESLDVPVRWQINQCKLAMRYVIRMGAEGEAEHSEMGVTRKYNTVDDYDLLQPIVPYAKVNS